MKPRKQLMEDLQAHIRVCEGTGNSNCISAKLARRSLDEIERLSGLLFVNSICPNEGHFIGPKRKFERSKETDEILQL